MSPILNEKQLRVMSIDRKLNASYILRMMFMSLIAISRRNSRPILYYDLNTSLGTSFK